MKNKGKILVMVLVLLVALCGCGSNKHEETAATTGSGTTTTTTAPQTYPTGDPITISASTDSDLVVYSPNGQRPSAETIERLAAICKANRGDLSLYYKDLTLGYTITYQADKSYQAASVIKAPYVKDLLAHNVDFSEKLTLQTKEGGSTHIDSKPLGTQFTVGELLEYTVRYSDNSAYRMLNQRFGFKDFNTLGMVLGVEANKKGNCVLSYPKPRFGFLSAKDIGLYFEDIAQYIHEGSDNAKQLYSWMITTTEQRQIPDAYTSAKKYTIEDLKDKAKLEEAWNTRFKGYTIAHKYGEQGVQAYHDGAIVFRDHPYVFAVTSTLEPYAKESIDVYHDIAMLIDQIQTDLYTY